VNTPRTTIKRILIADDRDDNRYYLKVLLEGNGFQVTAVCNGEEVLDKLRSEKFDAVISDILMPGMDGFRLCRTIKEDPALSDIPFIFYSASYTEEKDREFGLSLGADEYISKPVEPDDFIRTIRSVFERREAEKPAHHDQHPPDNLSFYSTYADTLGRKLDRKVVESEQHRRAARFSEEKYLLFLKNLQGIGYLVHVGEFIPVIFEGQVSEISGYEAEDFLSGRVRWQDIIHPDDIGEYLKQAPSSFVSSGSRFSMEYRIVHKSGDIRWLHETATCLPDLPDDSRLIQGAIYDVSREKLAEEELRKSEEHYRMLYEMMAEGIVFQDKSGSVIRANPSAERILGLTLDQIRGRTSMDPRWRCIHEDGSPFPGEDHPAMVSLRTGERNQQIMGVFNPSEAKYHWIQVNSVPRFMNGEDAPYEVFTTFEDITQTKEAADHIDHLNRVLKAIRMVNLLITTETRKEILLYKVCSFLAQGGGYAGVWIILDSDTEVRVFQETDGASACGNHPELNISAEQIRSWIPSAGIRESEVLVREIMITMQEEGTNPSREGFGVMIAAVSPDNGESGFICACMPGQYLHDPEEKGVFLEIARDIGFALNHITVVQREESARNALQAREKQYRELVETISDTLFTISVSGVITYMSPAIQSVAGLDPSHYSGSDFLQFIHPEDRDSIAGSFSRILQDQTLSIEFRSLDSQNRVHHLRVKAAPVRADGKVVGISGVLSDISAWKESENIKAERMKEVEALLTLHLLMSGSEEVIFSYALEAAIDITKSSSGFVGLVHTGGKELEFQTWSPDVMKACLVRGHPHHSFTTSDGILSRCISTREPVILNEMPSESYTGRFPEGHIPISRFLVVPILAGDQVAAIIAVANRPDAYTNIHVKAVTTLGNTLWEIIHAKRSDKEIQRALTQIAQNMEQLATLNDEIRNPLTIISLISDMTDDESKTKLIEAVQVIDDIVKRLDMGWIQSEKVRNFLIKHYQFTKGELETGILDSSNREK